MDISLLPSPQLKNLPDVMLRKIVNSEGIVSSALSPGVKVQGHFSFSFPQVILEETINPVGNFEDSCLDFARAKINSNFRPSFSGYQFTSSTSNL
ncbi:hypothetical protein GOBAR_AA34249 [Gossypium barbadense]|uniref:Uncharacterized protein n=1 Tax=Gossypium barbadense TaxID=3634 RepID=A0A2P5W5U1_GOSBA|nr:hypothetical protein GOBAR_AA34249 [Gossypium barbadense]